MKHLVCLALLSLVCLSSQALVGIATMKGTSNRPQVQGSVTITSVTGGLRFQGNLTGFDANTQHGFHVHEWGDISKADGTGTGGHWNPQNVAHGLPPNTPRHYGDLGNIMADANGNIDVDVTIPNLIGLSGSNSVIGHGLIVHASQDTGAQPTGAAGARYAQGVIALASQADNTAAADDATKAMSVLKPVTGASSSMAGTVEFFRKASGAVRVMAHFTGLPADSYHGFHIHTYGDIADGTGAGCGAHFNPLNQSHGYEPNPARHVGDMKQLHADANGEAKLDWTDDLLKLGGDYSIVGRCVVVHSGGDAPGVAYGSKLMVGVVGVSNQAEPADAADNRVGVAVMRGTAGNAAIKGTVRFTQLDGVFVRVEVDITGLGANSKHGLHVHALGNVSKEDGTSTGGHYNPNMVDHGLPGGPYPAQLNYVRHVGDMGNIQADANGEARVNITLDKLRLYGNESIVGRGVVLHALEDTGAQPTGAAGSRLATGVIGVANGYMAEGGSRATPSANCIMHATSNGHPNMRIEANFYRMNENDFPPGTIRIVAFGRGLGASGKFGFHVHEYGDMTKDDGTSAGGHFNPTNMNHALPDAKNLSNKHVGDMGNFFTDHTGVGEFIFTQNTWTFDGPNSIIGRALVLHELVDDGTGASGHAGPRIMIGVIGQADDTSEGPLEPANDKKPNVDETSAASSLFASASMWLCALIVMMTALAI